MPGPTSKESRALANVRLQLKTCKTRGENPRKLTADEILALEQKAAQLQGAMAEARHQRSAARVNSHTTEEAEQTRAAVAAEGEKTRGAVVAQLQPLTRLIDGENGTIDERIKARQNQISFLHAANRQDRLQRKQQLDVAREGRSLSAARRKRPRVQITLNAPAHPCRDTAVVQSESHEVEEDKQADIEEADADSSDESDGSDDSSSIMEEDLSLLVSPLPQPMPQCAQPEESTEVGEDPGEPVDTTTEQAASEQDAGAAKETVRVQGVVIALGGEPAHVLLRSTSCKTVALRADAVLACEAVTEWSGDVEDFNDGYDYLFACVWQDILRHINYGKPSAEMAKVWNDLRALVELLGEKPPSTVKVKLAGTLCRGNKLYEVRFAADAVVHELKN